MATIAELLIKVDSSQVESATQKLKDFTKATSDSAKAEDQARKSKGASAEETAQLLAVIDKQTKSIGQLTKQQQALNDARDSNSIDTSTYEKYNQIIQQNMQLVQQRGTIVEQVNRKEADAEERRYQAWFASADKQVKAEESILQQRRTIMQQMVDETAKAEEKRASIIAKQQQQEDRIGYAAWNNKQQQAKKEQDALEKEVEQTNRALNKQHQELQRVIGVLDPLSGGLRKIDNDMEVLRRGLATGDLGIEEFKRLETISNRSRQELIKYNSTLEKTGISAKQLRLAQQQLPAQFTDIFVSLQGGMPIMTVLLQQGGQIKDMFGGVVPALKGVASGILAMVNPFTIAAAAAATLATAWYQGSEEMTKFNKAIIMTGNYSGVTAGQLSEMAAAMDKVGGTQRQAAAALTEVVSRARFTSESIQGIAQAAVDMERATGKAVSATVDEFVKLAEKPAEASVELNKQYNYLTAATYSQIVALQEQGKEYEAAALAIETFREAQEQMAERVQENAGYIEKAWNAVKSAATEAWDEMLGVGREKSINEQLDEVRRRQAGAAPDLLGQAAENLQAAAMGPGALLYKLATDTANAIWDQTDAGQERLKQEETLLGLRQSSQAQEAAYEGLRRQNEQAAIEAQQKLDKILESSKSKADKLKEAYAELDTWFAQAAVKGVKYTEEQMKAIRESVRKGIEDKGGSKGKSGILIDQTEITELDGQIKLVETQYKSLYQKLDAAQKGGLITSKEAYEQRKALLVKEKEETAALYESQIASYEKMKKSKGASASQISNLDQKIIATRAKMVEAETEAQGKLDTLATAEQGRIEKLKRSYDDYLATLERQVELIRRTKDQEAAAVGMGKARAAIEAEKNQIRQKTIDQEKELLRLRDLGAFKDDPEQFDKRLEALKASEAESIRVIEEGEAKKKAAHADWRNGAIAAIEDYRDASQDVSGQTYDVFTGAIKGMEDYLVGFVTGAKSSFKDLVKSIIADLARIQIKKFLGGALDWLTGSGGSSSGSGFLGGVMDLFSGSSSSGGGSGSGFGNIVDIGKKIYSVYDTLTGVGSEIASGFMKDGLTGALKGGLNYYSTMLEGVYSKVASWFGQAVGQTAVEVGTQVVTNVGYGLGQQVVTGAVGEAAYAGATSAATSAAAGAGTSFLQNLGSSLVGYASNPVGWIMAAITASYKFGQAGVRLDSNQIEDTELSKLSAKIDPLASFALHWGMVKPVEWVQELGSKLFGDKWGATLSGGALISGIHNMLNTAIFGKQERFKTTVASATGTFANDEYRNTGKVAGWYEGSKQFGTDVEEQLHAINATFSATLDSLFEMFDIEEEISTEASFRLRRTSGKLATVFSATIGDAVMMMKGQYSKDGNVAKGLEKFMNDVMGRGLAQAIGISSLPAYIKEMTAGIKDAQKLSDTLNNIFNKFNGVNSVLEAIGQTSLGLTDGGFRAVDSLLATAGALAELENPTEADKLKAFSEIVGQYSNSFLTDSEKFANGVKDLRSQFASMGQTLPETRDGFKAVVAGLDLTKVESQKTFFSLLNMSEALGQYYTQMEELQSAFYSAFTPAFTQSQDSVRKLSAEFTKLGVSMPQTREGFRALVEGIDTTTEAGKNLKLALLEMSGSMNDFYSSIEVAKTGISSTFDALRESIYMDTLGTDQNKYNYLKAQADQLAALLPNLYDPEAILATTEKIAQLTGAARGLLSEEGKQAESTEFVRFLDEVQKISNEQLAKVNTDAAQQSAMVLEEAINRAAENMASQLKTSLIQAAAATGPALELLNMAAAQFAAATAVGAKVSNKFGGESNG